VRSPISGSMPVLLRCRRPSSNTLAESSTLIAVSMMNVMRSKPSNLTISSRSSLGFRNYC
jgi:hypothetical protein